jgi:hypothetical protein
LPEKFSPSAGAHFASITIPFVLPDLPGEHVSSALLEWSKQHKSHFSTEDYTNLVDFISHGCAPSKNVQPSIVNNLVRKLQGCSLSWHIGQHVRPHLLSFSQCGHFREFFFPYPVTLDILASFVECDHTRLIDDVSLS